MGWLSIVVVCLVSGCRFGVGVGTSRRPGNDENISIVQLEGGGYRPNGLGGFVSVGALPGGQEDNDSIHNSDSPWLIGDVRYRRAVLDLTGSSRVFAAAAAGGGLCRRGLITQAQLELGIELLPGHEQRMSFDLSARYSPLYIVGDDDPTYAILIGFAGGRAR